MSSEEAERWLSHLSDVYDYSIWRADRSLGLILDVFRSRGWLDEDYRLVITSDHGEYLGEHQMVEHGREFFYEPVTRVPFIYYSTEGAPDLPGDLPALASHTLLRDGILPNPLPPSLSSVFRKPHGLRETNPPCSFSRAALWQGGTKLVADSDRVMRFDLVADPEEDEPSPADDHSLAPELLAHCRALDDAYASRPAVDPEIDAQVAAQLRALGYLSDGDESPPPEPSDVP